MTARSHRR